MKKTLKRWTNGEIAYLKANYQEKTAAEMAAHLGRSRESVATQLMRYDLKIGRGKRGVFVKGHKHGVGRCQGVAANPAYHWKPGQQPACTLPEGATRECRDGGGRPVIQQKVGGKWVRQHVLRWEQVNGSVPAGHVLASLSGNNRNTDPENWECITRAENARRNRNATKAGETTHELWEVVKTLAANGQVHNSPAGQLHARRQQMKGGPAA